MDRHEKFDKTLRVLNCLVAPETLRLLKPLAVHLKLSQGQTIDRAVAALAVAESFGGSHLNLKSRETVEPETVQKSRDAEDASVKLPRGVREKR